MPTSYGNTLPITVPQLSDSANIVTALTGMYYGTLNGATATPSQLYAEANSIGGYIQKLFTDKANYADNLSVFASTTSLQLKGLISDETGSGSLVFATSPTLVTPTLGVATATSINGTEIPTSKTLVTTSDTGTITSTMILDGTIVNADINVAAGITYSKLVLTGSILNADISTSAAIAYSKLALIGSIVNADIKSDAAIAYSKLSLSGSIVNADVKTDAAIAYSKLALTGGIVNADINATAAIAKTKIAGTAVTLADSGTITSTMIVDGTIVNADISDTANIAVTKIANGSTTGLILRSGSSGPEWASIDTIPISSAAQVANAVTFNSSGTGATSPQTFNGSATLTVSHNTIGAAALSHTHGNITNDGKIGSTSGLMIKTTTAGALTALAAGTSGQFLRHDGTWGTIDYTQIQNAPAEYTPTTATSLALGGIKLASDTVQSVVASTVSSTASRTYASQLNASGQLVINVPWTDTIYTLPAATTTVLGGVKVDDASIQIASGTISVKASGITNSMLAGSIDNNKLTNSTISGVSLGGTLKTLTFGSGFTGTSYNGSAIVTLGVDTAIIATLTATQTLTNKTISGADNTLSNIPNSATTATNANTASAIVARDSSGNFTAGTITAALSGNATSATASTFYAVTGSASTSSARNKVFVSPTAPTVAGGAVAGDLWFW